MQPKLITPAILLSSLWLVVSPALAQGTACVPSELSTALEKRLVALDRESPDALRRFIQRTAPVYQLSWHDTKVWLHSRRDGAACLAGTDAARPAGPQATITR